MDETGGASSHEHGQHRGEGGLGDLAQLLIDNPWMHQALQVAFGARQRATQAGASAIRNLNLPTGTDLERLARRLRATSERLEAVEDAVDRLSREVAELRQQSATRRGEGSSQGRP